MDDVERGHRHKLDRTVYSHSELHFAATWALERGKENDDNKYDFLTAVVLAAFAFEAYVNFVGAKKILDWRKSEREPIRKKLKRVCNAISVKPDWNKRPFDACEQLRLLRNEIAHAHTVSISEEREGFPEEPIQYPKAPWEKAYCSEVADRLVPDIKEVMLDPCTPPAISKKGDPEVLGSQGGSIIR